MLFVEWLRYKGLSEATVEKYQGAVDGSISDWAMANDIIAGPLFSITNIHAFALIKSKIVDLQIFKERNSKGHNMYLAALNKFEEYLGVDLQNDIESDLAEILSSEKYTVTEKTEMTKLRIGQGLFRQKLIGYWKCCSVTGYRDVNLLVASHIKPWAISSSVERLDMYNGLLLVPNLDYAFDSGFISFSNSGEILISPLLTDPYILGISESQKIRLETRHSPYIEFHRERVFRSV